MATKSSTRKSKTGKYTPDPRKLAYRHEVQARVRAFAKKYDFTHQQLGELFGVRHGTVSKWLTVPEGIYGPPNFTLSCKIAQIIDEWDDAEDSSPITEPVQAELALDPVPSEEQQWLLEGYRTGAVKSEADETGYLLTRYRKKEQTHD
jgi:transcriptional regulator with XRE-family HTH domain